MLNQPENKYKLTFDFNGIVLFNKTKQIIEFSKIKDIYAKMNDPNASTRLCIDYDNNGETLTRELICFNRKNLEDMISSFIVNFHNKNQASSFLNPVNDLGSIEDFLE